MSVTSDRIPEEILAEQWYRFVHHLIGDMQSSYRQAQMEGITQKKIAARLGKKPSFISRCLSGQQNMTIRTIYNLARAMGFRLEISFRPLAKITPSNRSSGLEEAAKSILSQTASGREAEFVELRPREPGTTTGGTILPIFSHAA